MSRGVHGVWHMLLRSVVVYRGKLGEHVVNAMDEYFPLESVEVRGLGRVFRYETERYVAYIVRVPFSYEANVKRFEATLKEALGHVNEVIAINPHIADPREGLFVHSAGNVGGEGFGGLQPLSVSPTSPEFMGTFILAALWVGEELGEASVHIEATHDLPVDATIPYVSVEYRGDYADELALALGAALGRRGKFKPYMTVGLSYYADEFIPLVKKKRIVPAYHVPVYMGQHLVEELARRLLERGWIRGVIYGRGLEPAGLSDEEGGEPAGEGRI